MQLKISVLLILFHILTAPVYLIATSFLSEKASVIINKHCLACHGETQVSGLDLRTREAALKGGTHGPAVIPGDAINSLLYQAVLQTGKLKMPVGGALSEKETQILHQWIQDGFIWIQDSEAMKTSSWWAFETLQQPSLPAVKNKKWINTPVDAFILQKLEENNLQPASPANKLTLLRRAKFDLHGIPPSEQEIKDFIEDSGPNAFSRLIDRLLASPRYGEQWARHWLDVARYADSSGLDEDVTMPYAWRYRDYVIETFNQDIPYNQFIREQIAGDLYSSGNSQSPNVRGILGTGFLAIGPRAIAQQDKLKMVYDFVDEQIDTVSKTFMGLTISCARCHDHKFDPISTKDYYSLASIFASTRSFDKLKNGLKPPHVSTFYFEPLVPKTIFEAYVKHQDKIKTREAAIEALIQNGVAKYSSKNIYPHLGDYMLAAHRIFKNQNSMTEVLSKTTLDQKILERWIQYLKPGNALRPYLEKWYNAKGPELIQVTQEYQDLFDDLAKKWHQKILIWERKVMKALREETAPPRKPETSDDLIAVKDRFFLSVTTAPPTTENSKSDSGPFGILKKDREDYLPLEITSTIASLREEVKHLKVTSPPEPPIATAVSEGDIVDQKVFIRGNHNAPGETVEKQFPVVLAGMNQKPIVKGSGRKEFAEWLSHSSNPLTPRVMVNRIWQWHFGEGLVRTPNNFGSTGEKPTHKQLLDFLAVEFTKSNWSIKSLHRILMLSNTYQQSSSKKNKTMTDLDNQLWSHAKRRRLTVEEIRDAFLALDGELNLSMGGTLGAELLDYKQQGPEQAFHPNKTKRRTIYIPIIRNKIPGFMKLFDFADSSSSIGKRDESNVATQALYMMNSNNVHERSLSLARYLLNKEKSSTLTRIERAYLITLTRKPNLEEKKEALLYLNNYPPSVSEGKIDSQLAAWQSFCRILITSNEFIYLN